jgi:hypothetical protein
MIDQVCFGWMIVLWLAQQCELQTPYSPFRQSGMSGSGWDNVLGVVECVASFFGLLVVCVSMCLVVLHYWIGGRKTFT